jgi:epoxyqueuosine reductase QueG
MARHALIRHIGESGGTAIAPSIEADYHAENMCPMWSERHAAYVAGLGTFGIHGALITEKDCSGRIGSVVTDLEIAPTPRPYTRVYEYCPYQAQQVIQQEHAPFPASAMRVSSTEGVLTRTRLA